MMMLLMIATGFTAAFVAVGGVRRYALARSILDLPNERSSHDVPTPRGGGLGLILPFVGLAGLYLAATGQFGPDIALALGATVGLAVVGWIDDRSGVSVRARLLIHVATGIALLPLLVTVSAPSLTIVLGATVWVLAAVSAVNVINFMDGIDGLIGSQLLLFGVHLAVLSPSGSEPHIWGLVLAASCAGFLLWNWPPARIFMGDAGSGALGLTAVAGGMLLVRGHGLSPVAAFLPLYPLFLDAATTLARRALRRERIWEAHRSHLYQRLANDGWGHRRVTLIYAVASTAGIPVGALAHTSLWPVLVTSYVFAVTAIGAALNRSAPGPPMRVQPVSAPFRHDMVSKDRKAAADSRGQRGTN
jgi:Fuc2NAc and GlcNAc transferase